MNTFSVVNITFHDVADMIHDVNRIANPFPYAAKFIFVSIRNNKLNKSDLKDK